MVAGSPGHKGSITVHSDVRCCKTPLTIGSIIALPNGEAAAATTVSGVFIARSANASELS
jgi:hypothetical protein